MTPAASRFRGAVATVAEGYLTHVDPRRVIEWFDLGGSLQLGDTVSAEELVARAGDVQGLALVKWDVSAIPPGSRILSAELTFWVTGAATGPGYRIFDVRRAWEESEVTWRRGWQVAGLQGDGDRGTRPLGALGTTPTGFATLPLNDLGVALVQSWVNAPAANFGIVFVAVSTTPPSSTTSASVPSPRSITFGSRNETLARPAPSTTPAGWRTTSRPSTIATIVTFAPAGTPPSARSTDSVACTSSPAPYPSRRNTIWLLSRGGRNARISNVRSPVG